MNRAVFILEEFDDDVLLGLLLDLLHPAYPLAPILVLSGPVSRVRCQTDGVDVHRRQLRLIDHIDAP